MAIIINGTSYSGKNGIKTGGDFYSKVVLAASVSGSPAAGTAFSALTVSASITLPDLGINTPISVTGFTRSNGTVVAGTNTMTVTWKGISKTITFTGVSGGGGGTITLNHSTLSIAEDGTSTLTATLTGSLIGQPITWSAGNANVTISGSGATVTLTAAGEADSTCVITASCGGQTATCTVTITAAGGGDPGVTPGEPVATAFVKLHEYAYSAEVQESLVDLVAGGKDLPRYAQEPNNGLTYALAQTGYSFSTDNSVPAVNDVPVYGNSWAVVISALTRKRVYMDALFHGGNPGGANTTGSGGAAEGTATGRIQPVKTYDEGGSVYAANAVVGIGAYMLGATMHYSDATFAVDTAADLAIVYDATTKSAWLYKDGVGEYLFTMEEGAELHLDGLSIGPIGSTDGTDYWAFDKFTIYTGIPDAAALHPSAES